MVKEEWEDASWGEGWDWGGWAGWPGYELEEVELKVEARQKHVLHVSMQVSDDSEAWLALSIEPAERTLRTVTDLYN